MFFCLDHPAFRISLFKMEFCDAKKVAGTVYRVPCTVLFLFTAATISWGYLHAYLRSTPCYIDPFFVYQSTNRLSFINIICDFVAAASKQVLVLAPFPSHHKTCRGRWEVIEMRSWLLVVSSVAWDFWGHSIEAAYFLKSPNFFPMWFEFWSRMEPCVCSCLSPFRAFFYLECWMWNVEELFRFSF